MERHDQCRHEHHADTEDEDMTEKPEVICLCGSTRFYDTFQRENYRLTLEGKIVLSIGCDTKSDEGLEITDEQKVMLDELHKRKIDLADRILVLNVGGYIGSSTRSEILYADSLGMPIDFLEQWADDPEVVMKAIREVEHPTVHRLLGEIDKELGL